MDQAVKGSKLRIGLRPVPMVKKEVGWVENPARCVRNLEAWASPAKRLRPWFDDPRKTAGRVTLKANRQSWQLA
jgi:hypothetical protein